MWNNNRMQAMQNHPYRIWQRVVSALACMVMLITSYGGMILPVKATEQTAYCGHEEHQHSQECYEKRLICGHEETTGEPHVHTAECYQQQRVLICGLEETPGHIHDESCVKVDKIQTCTDESEDHVHSDGCYQTQETYTCGKKAGEGGHTHGESCYETRDVLTCEIHVHTEACYEEVLVCDQEEHTHSLSCFSDPEADVESETVWENSVSGVELTGVWAEDVIAIAESQLGYTESERNYTVTGDGARKGYTRYGDWYGDPYGDWSAMFVSFCLYYAGISRQSVPYASDCAGWVGTLAGETWGLYRSMEGNSPQKGDIVFLDTDADGSADQAGLVASVSGGSLRVIVGDSENSVRTVSCAMSSDSLLGFAALPENPSNLTTQVNDAALVSLEGDDGAAPADGAGDLTITLGQTLNVEVVGKNTKKIAFTPECTHQYIFQSTGTGDTYGYIYDANGNQLASDDDSGGSGQFKITYTLNAGETYYLGVSWYRVSSTGTIPVLLTYGNHAYTKNGSGQYVCTCGEPAPTIPLNETLNVDVVAGQTVRVPFVPAVTHEYILQSTGEGGAVGYLYNAQGNQLTSSNGGSSGQFKITYTLNAGETYYLGIRRYSGSSGTIPVLLTYGNHSYAKNESEQFTCTTCGEPAPTITLNETLNVDVVAGQTVRIPFVPAVTHEYIFRSAGTGDTDGYIFDANGNQLVYNGGYGEPFKITYTLNAGETYYLGVKWHYSDRTGTIPVLLTYGGHVFAKGVSGQYICICGETAAANEGELDITLDQNLIVEAAEGETVTIPFVPEITHEYIFQSIGAARGVSGYICNPSGDSITSGGGRDSQFRISAILTAGKTYYFRVKWDDASKSGMIPVLLTCGSHVFVKDGNGRYVCGCGETAQYAITLDQALDVDVAAGETVKIPFEPMVTHQYVFQSTGTGYTDGYLYDAQGNQLTSSSGRDSGQFKITYTLNAGETYYLGVSWYRDNSSGTIPVLLTYGNHTYTKNGSGQYVCTCGESMPAEGTCGDGVYWRFEDGTLTISGNGVMYNYAYSNPVPWESLRGDITDIVVKEGVTSIGDSAFAYCRSLTSVTIPEGVTSIGDSAFNNCSSLTSVTIPEGVTSIERDTFNECRALTSVTIPKGVTSIGDSAFHTCSSLTSVTIPEGVTSIGSSAFYYCSSLTSVTIPEGVTSIGNSAFSYCDSLTTVTIPEGVTSIGTSVFYDCRSLTSVTIPESVTSIGNYAFYCCDSLTTMTIPESVTSIGYSTFSNCDSLTTVTIPKSVTSIGGSAFYGCSSLTSVTIPEGVQTIDRNPFSRCDNLDTLVWNGANTSLSDSDTRRVGNFTLVIGKDVRSIGEETFAALGKMEPKEIRFERPNYLTLPNVRADSLGLPLSSLAAGNYYVDPQGVLYRIQDGSASLAYWPPELAACTIPATVPGEDGSSVSVTGVDSHAFAKAKTLKDITFAAPEAIKELRDYAFADAAALERINGKGTQDEVLAVFSQAAFGIQMFAKTAIKHSDNITDEVLELEKENLNLKISTSRSSHDTAEEETFRYYTGESAITSITISNPDSGKIPEGTIVRILYKFDSAGASLNYSPGTYTLRAVDSRNAYKMTVTDNPLTNCYVIDIERPREGDTLAVNFSAAYPSPTTAGGNADIWGGILSAEEVQAQGAALLPPNGSYHRINWGTKPDSFTVTKELTKAGSAVTRGDGEGGAYISGLSYTIRMSRQGQTLEGIGKDFITSVNFRDVLTLPEGAKLSPQLVQAIQEKSYTVQYGSFYLNGDRFLQLLYSPRGASLEIDKDGNLVASWTKANSNLSTEIENLSCIFAISDGYVQIPDPEPGKTYTVTNQVTATMHYRYSADQIQSAKCQVDVAVSEGMLDFHKERVGSVSYGYFGDQDCLWRITASNPSVLPYGRLSLIEDELPSDFWLTGEQLAALFREDPERQLTVTISRASLCAPHSSQTVTGIDGVTTGSTSLRNTGGDIPYNGRASKDPDAEGETTITLKWGGDGKLLLTPEEGEPQTCTIDGASIQAALDKLGFLVTADTRYKLCWNRQGEDGKALPLSGGQTIVKEISCTAKDTFMRLNLDEKNYHPNSGLSSYNHASAYEITSQGNLEKLKSGGDRLDLNREFFLYKGMAWNGQDVEPGTPLGQGDAVTYSLLVQHSGSGSYDLLPLTDHMTGSQALLVPREKNQNADWRTKCETVTLEDREYYLMTEPGTYSHVWTSDTQLANTVTVTKTASGFDTLMKWYFTDYTGSRTDTVSYQAYVCPSLAVPGAVSYSLGNESWLNDHATHRLYDVVGWRGTLIGSDKEIVDNVGDIGEGRVYSQIHEGEKVTYRLMLESYMGDDGKPVELTVSGASLYDALPMSTENFRWSRENVHISYQKESENYKVVNENSWNIDTTQGSDQQLLKWGEDFSITFRGKAYIYVTLDFPEKLSWQNYAARYSTTTLVNTFHALNMESSVTHELAIPARVRIQKGVYSTGYWCYDDFSNTKTHYTESWTSGCRQYYNNDDAQPRFVKYYVSLYNGGETNLYLTDMQDRLPRGFTLWWCDSRTGDVSATVYRADGTTKASHQTATISTSTRTVEGTQYVTFHFGRYNGRYDEARKMCYLAPGEAIKFAYICQTNQTADTDIQALNTISMPYYDYNGGGVEIDTDSRTVVANSDKYAPNDGGCELWDNGQAQNAGLTGGTTDTKWLTSQVTVVRGGIKPGITKALSSKTDVNGVETRNPVSALSTDTLNWAITAENDGTLAITDYVLTDVMQMPYGFSGKVDYRVYAPDGRVRWWPYYGYLFEISPGNSDGMLRVSDPAYGSDHWTTFVRIDGLSVTIPVHLKYSGNDYYGTWLSIQLSFKHDEAGNLVMSIHFPKEMAIPEGGKGVLKLSTKRIDSEVENRQFVNTAYITPLTQTWDGGTNKGNMTTLTTPFADNALPSVRNSAPVTTTYGYMTSSSIRITEAGNPANTAASTDDPNYIVLENAGKQFYYTLSVENTTNKAMNELILISNLPQTNDHSSFLESDPRFSEFKVSLAEESNFTVTVTAKDGTGTVITLDPSQYTIEFSDKTEYDASDWNGTSTWDSAPADSTRSVRLKISDEAGTMIPEGSTVSLTFTCEIEGDADPGTAAWNSFGYHYRLKGESFDLEAAPLKVGVKTPSVPELKKRIVDHTGKEITVEKDTAFSFLVYPGAALTGDYDTELALTEELDKQEVSYQKYTVKVPAGQSQSTPVPLAVEGWKWTANKTWTKGQQYTVTELPCPDAYAFSRFQGSTGASYTFTYDPAQTQVIICDNTSQNWAVSVTKVNTSEEPLSGAVFALYSPVEQDRISEIPEEYQKLSIEQTLQRDNKTWYLKAVDTTDEEGKLTFRELLREKYYLLEVKPPVGYELSDLSGQLLEQKYEVQGVYEVTVVNRREIDLPKTGGIGIDMLYTVGGILLIQCAVIFLLTGRNGRAAKKKGRNQP